MPFSEHNESLNAAIAAELDYWGLAFGSGAEAPIDAVDAVDDVVADAGPFSSHVRDAGVVVEILLGGTDFNLAQSVARAICKEVSVSWPNATTPTGSRLARLGAAAEGFVKCLPKKYAWIVIVSAETVQGRTGTLRPPDHRWSDLEFSPMIFKIAPKGTTDDGFVSVYYKER